MLCFDPVSAPHRPRLSQDMLARKAQEAAAAEQERADELAALEKKVRHLPNWKRDQVLKAAQHSKAEHLKTSAGPLGSPQLYKAGLTRHASAPASVRMNNPSQITSPSPVNSPRARTRPLSNPTTPLHGRVGPWAVGTAVRLSQSSSSEAMYGPLEDGDEGVVIGFDPTSGVAVKSESGQQWKYVQFLGTIFFVLDRSLSASLYPHPALTVMHCVLRAMKPATSC